MNLCFIASRLSSGGFTPSMLAMMKQLTKEGHICDLIFLDSQHHERPSSLVDSYHVMNVQNAKRSMLDFKAYARIRKLKKETADMQNLHLDRAGQVRKMMMSVQAYVMEWLPVMDLSSYDCVISWEELTCNYFLAFNVKAKRKIGYIHPDYILSAFDRETDYPALKKLDAIASVSKATTETLRKVFPELKDRIVCIPNLLDEDYVLSRSLEKQETFEKSSFDIVTVCRLSIYHKGLDRLMHVAARLNQDGFQFQWYICGDGEGRKQLEIMMKENDLKNVHLLGDQPNPYPFMKKAELFCLFSNYEGKPVVVDEALCLGLPVLVTDYASAEEQVKNGIDGFVVPMNDEAVYQKMKEILKNPSALEKMRQHLSKKKNDRYTDTSIFLKVVRG